MILKCTCKHDFQDREHGRGNRVHNRCNQGARCTVCGSIKPKGTPGVPLDNPKGGAK